MIDRLLEWLPDRAGMTNEVDGLLIGIPDRIGYNGENSGMTEEIENLLGEIADLGRKCLEGTTERSRERRRRSRK